MTDQYTEEQLREAWQEAWRRIKGRLNYTDEISPRERVIATLLQESIADLTEVDRLRSDTIRLTEEVVRQKDRAVKLEAMSLEVSKFVIAIADLYDSDRVHFDWDEEDEHGDVTAWISKAETSARIIVALQKP